MRPGGRSRLLVEACRGRAVEQVALAREHDEITTACRRRSLVDVAAAEVGQHAVAVAVDEQDRCPQSVDGLGAGHLCRERDHARRRRAEKGSRATATAPAERMAHEHVPFDAPTRQQVVHEQHVEQTVLERPGLR